MANTVRMSGNLPGTKASGVQAHDDDFLGSEAPGPMVVVAIIERKKRTVDDVTEEVTAATRITQIEPLVGDAKATALTLLREARQERTGEAELDGIDGDDAGDES